MYSQQVLAFHALATAPTPRAALKPQPHHLSDTAKTPGQRELIGGFHGVHLAETGGFEPPVEFNPDPSLAVKSVRPLRHVSIREHQQ